eukprot:6490773-Amphidinium_carterae.1
MPDGSLKVKKGKTQSTLPASPEELRQKVKLMQHMWELLKIRCPGKAFLQDTSFALWQSYVDWLLGEEVYACVVHSEDRSIQHRVSWTTLLDFELHVRKHMCYMLNHDAAATVASSLRAAMQHQPTMIRYLTTPTSLAAGLAAASQHSATRRDRSRSPLPRKRPAAIQRAPRANAAATRSRSWKAGLSNTTSDGKFKCFKFQRGLCTGPCDKEHVCLVCGGQHAMKDCPRKPKGNAPASA